MHLDESTEEEISSSRNGSWMRKGKHATKFSRLNGLIPGQHETAGIISAVLELVHTPYLKIEASA